MNLSLLINKFFMIRARQSSTVTEIFAGITTFATMSYIIFLQPMILSGQAFKLDTGMDFQALIAGTCIAAAFASILMGVLANYPIGLAPAMGENFFFVLTALPACAGILGAGADKAAIWQLALGMVFASGIIFLIISLLNVRKLIINSISPSLKNAIVAGIGLFIALLGLKHSGLIVITGDNFMLAKKLTNPAALVFFVGLTLTLVLSALKVRGGILWGILAGTATALCLGEIKWAMPFSLPPDPSPVFAKIDFAGLCKHFLQVLPIVVIFTFMVVFDTLGTLIGVATQAGLMKNNTLPNAERVFAADATATVFGSFCGHSTVTSYIESAAGVEYGGRTGLTAVVVGACFILAMFFAPFVQMVAQFAPITAPALIIVGAMMMKNIANIKWEDYTEAGPAFLIIVCIPFTSSIADGMAIGFIFYPLLKIFTGKHRNVSWTTYILGAVLLSYMLFIKPICEG